MKTRSRLCPRFHASGVVARRECKYHGGRRRGHDMSETPRQWKYLERRPGSSYQQLCIKGKRIWAWTLYCEFMSEKEPRTPEQLAEDWNVSLEAAQEATEDCQSDPPG